VSDCIFDSEGSSASEWAMLEKEDAVEEVRGARRVVVSVGI